MFGINPLANLIINILVNQRQLNSGLNSVHSRLTGLSNRFQNLLLLTGAIYSIKSYTELVEKLETNFIRIERVAREFKGPTFRSDIFDLAQNLSGIGIEDLQKIMKTAAQLGVRGRDNILEFSKVIGMLSNVTGESAQSIAVDLGKILQVFDLLPTDAERVSNAILKVADDFNATELEITNIVRRIGAFSKSIGLSVDETVAFAGAMKDVGVNTEIAASSLYSFFARLQTNPTKIAKLFGYNSEQEIFNFFKLLRTSPVDAITQLLQKIKELSPGEKLLFFKELELYGVRNAAALGTLAEKVDRLKTALDSANSGAAENTRLLQNQWDRANSLAGKIDDVSDAWKRFLFEFGNTSLIKGTLSTIENGLIGLEFAIKRVQGLSIDLDVDTNNPESINAKLQQLDRRLWELKQFRNAKGGFGAFDNKFHPNSQADNALLKIPGLKEWFIELNMMKSQGEFTKLGKQREFLNTILERIKQREESLKKQKEGEEPDDPLKRNIKRPDNNEIRREFNVLRAAEDEKSKSHEKFKGFMDLTEAWKNRILDMQDKDDVKIKKLDEIHDEAVEQNDHLNEIGSILRTRTFETVLG